MRKTFDFGDSTGFGPVQKRSKVEVGFEFAVAEMHDSGGDDYSDGGCSCNVRNNNLAKTIYTIERGQTRKARTYLDASVLNFFSGLSGQHRDAVTVGKNASQMKKSLKK
ncbi:hypothetical protein ACS0TY_014597 [Phlomoides rotata]